MSTWEKNDIQFPRLLAEIRAIGLTEQQYVLLNEAMDLTTADIDELLERAEREWENIKEMGDLDLYDDDEDDDDA